MEMRIALIVIGLFILIGIYVYHQWKSSRVVEKIFSEDEKSEDVLLSQEEVGDGDLDDVAGESRQRVEPALTAPIRSDATVEERLDPDDPRFHDLQATQEVTPVHQYEALDDSDDDDQDLIVIQLLAPEQQPFRGQAVLKALQAHKMRFGEFNIYHRIMEDGGQPESVFSIANMVKPGVLSPVELPQMKLQGLTFFLRLPSIIENTVAFDDMMHVAQQMAATLNGTLSDQNFGELNAEKISQLRSQLA